MEHYEVLGVRPTASTAEIRASYVALARRYHPDRLGSVTPAARASAAERMSRINAAWTVLGNRERRAHYDAAQQVDTSSSGATIRDAAHTWTPYGADDDDVDPRLLDDTPTGPPLLRRELAFLPAGLGAVGMFALLVGFVVNLGPLLAVGVLLLAGAGVCFLVVPLVALIRSSRADRL